MFVLTGYEKIRNVHTLGNHTGSIYIRAETGSLESTVNIEDLWKYIASGSITFNTSTLSFEQIYDGNDLTGDYEISVKLKSANTKGFSLDYRKDNDSLDKNLLRSAVNGANNYVLTSINNSGTSDLRFPSPDIPYTANTDVLCSFKIQNSTIYGRIGSHTATFTQFYDFRYIGISNWNNAKTVIYTDFKIKPL